MNAANKTNFWPLAIILVFVLFIAGTAGLVVLASLQKTDLVSNDYYEQELRYQARLDSLERTSRLTPPALVKYHAAGAQLEIALPPQHAGRVSAGRIELYRPSASQLDVHWEFKPDNRGRQALDLAALEPGLWKTRVSWTVDGKEFCVEQTLVLGRKS
jgi:hypothetical protein